MKYKEVKPELVTGGAVIGLAAIFVALGYNGELNKDDQATQEKDLNVECMRDDTSLDCTDLYSKAVAEAGRFDDARFYIGGGLYEAMRENEVEIETIEDNGLVQCFSVKADSNRDWKVSVSSLSPDYNRASYTNEYVPNHLALIYHDGSP
ncbi:MAG: hypothetical protein ACLFR0_03390, partial [Alphaproteobacteria bacterium]